jgi:16S rRNA (adenine1518-N6/adenine1519-N6)-dimethyltransferase
MGHFPQADKKFGQHFLHSPHVIKAITQDLPTFEFDAIIEVGPGPAVLTPYLKSHNKPLYLFEMDKRFRETLEAVVGADHLVLADALEVNWEEFLSERKIKSAWLVSNLPYNVSVPLTLSFMQCPRITKMTLMYQKEVAEKFNPREQKNSMSSLYALASIFFETKRLVDVPPGAFQPPPKVMSQVLSFARKEESLVKLNDWDKLEEFLRLVFQNRRKQLQGILKERINKSLLDEFWRENQIPSTIRAEALTLSDLLKLWLLDQKS